ncbi:MAG: hypothetical protein MZW92_24710 [Comamonadaceae bacterium]|nr:hypothetical protein [Comamonadaceae bacterium]
MGAARGGARRRAAGSATPASPVRVAVNLSARQLCQRADLIDLIDAAAAQDRRAARAPGRWRSPRAA